MQKKTVQHIPQPSLSSSLETPYLHAESEDDIVVFCAAPDEEKTPDPHNSTSLTAINTEQSDEQKAVENAPGRAIPIAIRKSQHRPTNIEVFTGQAVAVIDQVFEAREATDNILISLRAAKKDATELLKQLKEQQVEQVKQIEQTFPDMNAAKFVLDLQATHKDVVASFNNLVQSKIEVLEKIKLSLDEALRSYQWTPGQLWLYQWSLVFLLVLTSLFQMLFIELYCRWHGSYFVSFDLYNPVNVALLSQINFVGGRLTTMNIAAEVLTWSSLGVWAQQSYLNSVKMLRRTFRFADDGPKYIGIMMRNTSIAAVIIIILRLSKFSLFGVSLEDTNPLAFDFTIGLSFLLGVFGDDAYRILTNFRDRLVEGTSKKKES